ncbi:MAG TPA: Maf family protein [Candidatus Acidoferrales bacterium]|nr:Maf family protein [Candidatus Acidoferrales bacterium]
MSERLREVALASTSPRRKQLLESLGLDVCVVESGYDERVRDRGGSAAETALAHALGKARMAASVGPPVLVAADTIVLLDGSMLGKPRDERDAKEMLRRLSGQEHHVFTGFVVADRSTGLTRNGVEATLVRFRTLEAAEIDAYVATGDPMDKAGAYGIQGRGGLLVASIDGDFYTVMGLPLARVGASLRELGHPVLA